MGNNVLISIIVPVYKVEAYLSKCMDSLLSQTYKYFEILLIDDGSPDSCPEICDRYALQDTRVRVFHKQNGGQSSARNLGLDHVKGDYIAFVDSDDFVSPVFLERLYQRISDDGTDIAVCEYREVNNTGLVNTRRKLIQSDEIINSDDMWNWEATDYYMFCVALWNKLFKAKIWNSLRFKVGKYAEDSFAFTEYMKTVDSISILYEPLYYYYQRDNSEVHAFSIKNLDSAEARLERVAFHISAYKFELAGREIQKVPGSLLFAREKLGLTDPQVKSRYKELDDNYRSLYSQADNKMSFSKTAIINAIFIRSEALAFLIYRVIKQITRKIICYISWINIL